ncbi:MAG: FG-GAP-like repeat-containing protein [Betaproteobacteria bacterium]
MRFWRRGLCIAALSVPFLTLAAQSSDLTWMVTDRLQQVTPAIEEGLVAAAQHPARGVVSVAGDLVSLFEVGADGALLASGTFVADGPLKAVAVGDMDEDGRWELVSARGEEGALAVDRWVQGQRLPVGSTRYTWMPVKAIQLLSTRSGRMVVAAGQSGGLATCLVAGGGLEPAEVSEPRQRFELYGAADLDGDGQEELVAGVGQSAVVVLRWAPETGWGRWWQNYPWGGLVGAAAGDLDGDGRAELAVASRENLLYVFGKNEGGTGLSLRYQGSFPLPAGAFGLAHLAPARAKEGGPPGGLAIYGPDEVRLVFFTDKLEPLPGAVVPVGGIRRIVPLAQGSGGPVDFWPRLLVQRADQTLELVTAVPSRRLRFIWRFRNGVEAPVTTVLLQGGRWYVSLREAAAQFEVAVRWDGERRAAVFNQEGGGPLVEMIAGQAPRIGGQIVSEAGQVIADGGRMFLEMRGVERLFPSEEGKAPRLMVVVGQRYLPAEFLW